MTAIEAQTHPELSLDLEDCLDAEARERLRSHLAECEACRIERRLRRDFRAESTATPADPAAIARAVAAVLKRTTPEKIERTAPLVSAHVVAGTVADNDSDRKARANRKMPARWSARAVALVAAAVLLLSGVAGAAYFVRRARSSSNAARVPSTVVSTADVPSTSPSAVSTPTVELPPTPPTTAAASIAATTSKPSASAAESATVAELFAQANEARRTGDHGNAVRLYRELQRRFPGTREEITSRVGLGRLLLDRMADPSGALKLFDGYLATSPRGTLGEEARIGRALALARLGRSAEEREAWKQLLAAHPDSVYADRARKRITELEK